jgi:hypothetical protein
MYLKIEEEFKKKSLLRRSQIAFLGTYFLLAFLLAWFCMKYVDYNRMWLYILLYGVVFYIGVYVFIITRVCKAEDFHWKNIMDIEINTKLYQIQTHDKDIEILKIILKEHNVNTRPKQLEAIRHYQTLIPRNIIGGSSFISVLAFAISIIALMLDDKVYYNEENLKFIFTFLFVVSLIYLIFYLFNKNIFKLFGSAELYKRLESSISEIYMDNEKK